VNWAVSSAWWRSDQPAAQDGLGRRQPAQRPALEGQDPLALDRLAVLVGPDATESDGGLREQDRLAPALGGGGGEVEHRPGLGQPPAEQRRLRPLHEQ
jgi:hypothetical protein